MSLDNGPDDGQAEPGAVRGAGPVAAELPEGLEQGVDLLRRDERPGVAYLEFGSTDQKLPG